MIRREEPLMGDALQSVVDRGFIPSLPDEAPAGPPAGAAPPPLETDPAIVAELMEQTQASLAELRREIATKSGPALLDFILEDIQELKRLLFDRRSHQVFMSAMDASWWLNEHLEEWLGEKNVADTLTLSVPDNVTSEMGLALLHVADVIRPYPEVVAFLEQLGDEDFLDQLAELEGGRETRDAIHDWLERYGMRCVGEIDITRPRWSERPTTLVPLLLGNIRNSEPGAGERRFEDGRERAAAKEQEVLERLRALPDGATKAEETKRKIDRVRTFIGYREYPKYGLVSRTFVYKQALMEEAGRLVAAGVVREPEDVFFLTFQELQDATRTRAAIDDRLIAARKEAHASYQAFTPPRVLTSEGEAVAGAYSRDDLPAGALVGLAVSSGTIEGRARVILDMAEAAVEPGDILVTAFTDPSWSPLFVAVKGLVAEVGGAMTHGAVIAREYGLPAVVGVEHATTLIRDGQRIRVHGTEGYVEILS
jgi:pyruvate,water dikinase